MGENP